MALSHLSSGVRSSSPESITESDPWIKKTHLRRGSMMTSKCRKVRVRMNDLRRAPLEDHDKIMNRSSSRHVSSKWRRSCDSMKIRNSHLKQYMPQYDIRYMVGRKSDDMKSFIIKCVILVIQIEPKRQGSVSRNKKHDDIQISTKSQTLVQVGAVEDDI